VSVSYDSIGTVSAVGGTTLVPGTSTPGLPTGQNASYGKLAAIIWGNALDADLIYDSATWNFRGDAEGGDGSWGFDDEGTRHASAFFTSNDLTGTTQSFTNGGAADIGNMTIGYIMSFTKTLMYWAPPEVAEASDNAGGSGFSATFNRDPGFTAGDVAVLVLVANDDIVNPASIALTLPGTTQGTGTTAVVTSPFSQGHDSRVTIRRVTIAGTSNGTAPSVTSSTDFTGAALLIRLRDTDTIPVSMSAGPDQIDIEPYSTVTLDSSGSTGSSARTWSLQSGAPTVTLSSNTAVSPTFEAPGTLNGTTLVFRVTDDISEVYDEVSVTVLAASRRVKVGGSMAPIKRRVTFS
jgi:hypothetical protein